MYKRQGVADNEMVEDSVYIQYLTLKMQIKPPNGDPQIGAPYAVTVYHATLVL